MADKTMEEHEIRRHAERERNAAVNRGLVETLKTQLENAESERKTTWEELLKNFNNPGYEYFELSRRERELDGQIWRLRAKLRELGGPS